MSTVHPRSLCSRPTQAKIEPGMSEVCRALAGDDRTYYLFEGCKPADNGALHITSAASTSLTESPSRRRRGWW